MLAQKLKVLARHPRILLGLPKGRDGMTMKHADVEMKTARTLYQRSRGLSLAELFEEFDSTLCTNYKSCFLYAVVRNARPRVVVETGVASGVTSYSILQALEDNGDGLLYSIDLPNVGDVQLQKGQESGFLVPEGLRHRWTLTVGDSKQELPKLLGDLGMIDLFVHDSLHEYGHMMFEYEEAWPKLRKGGILFSDDISRTAAFQDFCDKHFLQASIVERTEFAWVGTMGWVVK